MAAGGCSDAGIDGMAGVEKGEVVVGGKLLLDKLWLSNKSDLGQPSL